MIAISINILKTTVSTSRICAVMNSTGLIFGTVHYALIALAYVFCFIVLAVIFKKTNRSRVGRSSLRLQSQSGHLKGEITNTVLDFILLLLSVVLSIRLHI